MIALLCCHGDVYLRPSQPGWIKSLIKSIVGAKHASCCPQAHHGVGRRLALATSRRLALCSGFAMSDHDSTLQQCFERPGLAVWEVGQPLLQDV